MHTQQRGNNRRDVFSAMAWLPMEAWQENWSPETWQIALAQGLDEASFRVQLAEATRTGRPLGDEVFLELCERTCGTPLRPQTRGPKAKSAEEEGAEFICGDCHGNSGNSSRKLVTETQYMTHWDRRCTITILFSSLC